MIARASAVGVGGPGDWLLSSRCFDLRGVGARIAWDWTVEGVEQFDGQRRIGGDSRDVHEQLPLGGVVQRLRRKPQAISLIHGNLLVLIVHS